MTDGRTSMSENVSQRQSAITRLKEMFGQAQHPYRPSTQIFLDLDVNHLSREMGLALKGAERGENNRPESSAETLDDVEHRVVERVETHKQDAHAIYLDHLHTYIERLTALNFEERISIIRQAASEAVGDFSAEASLGRDELFELRRRLNESEAEREEFRARHRISRPGRLLSTGKIILKLGVLAVLFVIEVIVNGGFLSKANESGYLGGITVALVFAAFNILVSFLLGLVPIRLMNRRNFFLKLLGFISLVGYLGLALLLNLALAHFREIPPNPLIDVGQEALRRLTTSPFLLTDVQSWLLFGIGLVFSMVAMVDGLLFFDPYIGYAGLERRWIAASRRYREAKEELIERLQEIRDDASDAMNQAARDLSVRRAEYDAILQARGRLSDRFVQHQSHIERACNTLLQIYREANRQARSSAAPTHFDRPYAMERIPVEIFKRDSEDSDQLRHWILETQDLLKYQIETIHRAFDAAARSYRQIDDLFPEPSYGQS